VTAGRSTAPPEAAFHPPPAPLCSDRRISTGGRSMAKAGFSAGGFLTRWVVALALVMVTFNPTSWSYLNWLLADWPGDNLPLKALVGVVLLIAFVIFLRSTWRAIGLIGLVLAGLFFAALLWVLIFYGWLDPTEPNLMTWVILVIIATVLATGLSWSHIRRRMSGQVDVDRVDVD
jgi:Family of unknown function (DUF6524)